MKVFKGLKGGGWIKQNNPLSIAFSWNKVCIKQHEIEILSLGY